MLDIRANSASYYMYMYSITRSGDGIICLFGVVLCEISRLKGAGEAHIERRGYNVLYIIIHLL